jgi:ribosomal protein S18 acetylase RimI-like enzyme
MTTPPTDDRAPDPESGGDEHVLDNAVWHALGDGQRRFARTNPLARRFEPDVSVFGAVDRPDADALAALASLGEPGAPVALFRADVPPAPDGWTEVIRGGGHQMVGRNLPAPDHRDRATMRPLLTEDVPQMLALVALTEPGPFAPRTIELGGYLGAFDGERLVAMAGQRLHPPGYREISAVCTHPDARGRGLATTLTLAVAAAITERGETPILHVAHGNDNARRLYDQLGFEVRRTIEFASFVPAR